MPQRSELPDTRTGEATCDVGSETAPPGTGSYFERCSPPNQTLKIRIGGWIAKVFSWYRY
jgi:hypothetical protein